MNVATITDDKVFRSPVRHLHSLLASVEKRCLLWLATRLPRWVTSDQLTSLALAAMLAAGVSYALARFSRWSLLPAVFSLAVNWFGDSLDGTLARVRHCERPRYGFYVDHVVDAVGATLLLGGLGLSGYMSPIVALSLLVAYLLLCVEVFLRTCCTGTFQMSFLNIGPTELRILLSIGTLAAMVHPTTLLFGRTVLLFDIAGAIGTIGLVGTFVAMAWASVRALHRAEPLHYRSSSRS